MNSGPLPPTGGLPAPLHERADARINYNSSLLGNLEPYAYGEPGYLSSQTAYLNIPHKIQKIIPVIHLPEAKVGAIDTFELSHPIDDGDIAFAMRLNRNSLFCTGLKNGEIRRAGLAGIVDPMINLCTLNYLLSGFQIGLSQNNPKDMWHELLYNLDASRFPQAGARDYLANPITLQDLIHVVRHCIRPMGVTRGSEKQGGQNEATLSPATWPVSFVVSLTIDGKESNVVNIWHKHDMSAGDDLVLRWKLMPLRQYTLNHYYKRVTRQNWGDIPDGLEYVWQLVPDIMHLEPTVNPGHEQMLAKMPDRLKRIDTFYGGFHYPIIISAVFPWQNLGYWHVGRSQMMCGAYGIDEYWNNDLANLLKTNHLDITFQPFFTALPTPVPDHGINTVYYMHAIGKNLMQETRMDDIYKWEPKLKLESMFDQDSAPSKGSSIFSSIGRSNSIYGNARGLVRASANLPQDAEIPQRNFDDLHFNRGHLDDQSDIFGPGPAARNLNLIPEDVPLPVAQVATSIVVDEPLIDTGLARFMQAEPPPPALDIDVLKPATTSSSKETQKPTKRRAIGGSILKTDGSSEARIVAML